MKEDRAQIMKDRYNRRVSQPVYFEIGDTVYVRCRGRIGKVQPRWLVPATGLWRNFGPNSATIAAEPSPDEPPSSAARAMDPGSHLKGSNIHGALYMEEKLLSMAIDSVHGFDPSIQADCLSDILRCFSSKTRS